MHHGFFEVHDRFQGNFTLSLCLRTLRPHHTRSVTSLPVNIFYRKIKKDLSLEGNTPSGTLHLLKETASSTHEETKVVCHSWTSIGAAWFCSVSLLCCPRGWAAPLFHLWTPQGGGAHRSPTVCVSNTQLARPPGRPKAVSWGGARCDSITFLTQLGLALPFSIPNTVCKPAWQLHPIAAGDFRLCEQR